MIAAYEPLMRNWRWGREVPHFTCRVCGFQTVPYPNGMDFYRQRLQSLVTGFEGWIKATKSQCSTGIFSGYIKVWHLATKSSNKICARRSYTPTDAIPLSLNSCLSALVSNISWATHAKPSQWEQKQYPPKNIHTQTHLVRFLAFMKAQNIASNVNPTGQSVKHHNKKYFRLRAMKLIFSQHCLGMHGRESHPNNQHRKHIHTANEGL